MRFNHLIGQAASVYGGRSWQENKPTVWKVSSRFEIFVSGADLLTRLRRGNLPVPRPPSTGMLQEDVLTYHQEGEGHSWFLLRWQIPDQSNLKKEVWLWLSLKGYSLSCWRRHGERREAANHFAAQPRSRELAPIYSIEKLSPQDSAACIWDKSSLIS